MSHEHHHPENRTKHSADDLIASPNEPDDRIRELILMFVATPDFTMHRRFFINSAIRQRAAVPEGYPLRKAFDFTLFSSLLKQMRTVLESSVAEKRERRLFHDLRDYFTPFGRIQSTKARRQ